MLTMLQRMYPAELNGRPLVHA